MKNQTTIIAGAVAAAFVAGGFVVYFWLSHVMPVDTAAPPRDATDTRERTVLYWHDPMVPGPRFDKPGKSPFMDMQLVPVYADESSTNESGQPIVSVRPEVINNLGVRTHEVKRAPLSRRAVSHGYLYRSGEDGGDYIQVDIFDRDADWVRAGMPARLSFDARPGESFSGRVAQIDADTGIGTRTLKAQIRVLAPPGTLKANMFAEVVIESPATALLAIPREALIRTGTRTAVVLFLGEGRFRPADVIAGKELGEFIEIQKGIREGDRVVISGQFLIDSEASLRATFTRLSPAPESKPADVPAPRQ